MKSDREVQRAHDMLVGIILGEAPMPLTVAEKQSLERQAAVLCWVLGHDHNPSFAQMLTAIEGQLQSRGIVLESHEN